MTKREGELKSAFTKAFKLVVPQAVILLFSSAGAPDRSITFSGHTTHWEFKHGTPGITSHALQELMCMRLEIEGHCRYVIWHESAAFGRKTFILRPTAVHHWLRSQQTPKAEAQCEGFNHAWLVAQVKKAHGC